MDTIGQLRYRIKFAVPLPGREDNYGGKAKATWIYSEELFSGREFKMVGSDEKESAAQKSAIQRVVFTIRGRDGIDTTMLILFEKKLYGIKSISKTERNDYLLIDTEQIGDQQDQSIVQQDGQSLIDAAGNAILWGPSDSKDEGYDPPGLKFRDEDGNLYERK